MPVFLNHYLSCNLYNQYTELLHFLSLYFTVYFEGCLHSESNPMNNSSTRPDSQPISTTDMNTVQYWFEHIPIITNTYQSLYNKDQSSLNIFDILYSKIYSNTAVLQAIPLDVLLNIGIYIFKVFINRHELKAIDDLCVPFSILIGFFPSFYFLYTYSQYSLSGYRISLLSFTN